MRKGGAGLDLPIAIGVLVAAGELDPAAVEGTAFVGELGLDGSLRPVPGTVVLAESLRGLHLVVAVDSAREAGLVSEGDVRTSSALGELVERLSGRRAWDEAATESCGAAGNGSPQDSPHHPEVMTGSLGRPPHNELSDVRGQRLARRALEVAAAGGHHLLMVGPPGSGKSMLANCLPGLLPPLDRSTALEVTRIHSVTGLPLPPSGLIERPPFRAPHHGTSPVAMIGGGTSWMRPGEISLAHGGVLFLDEMGEFSAEVLDALRQPLEDGEVRVSRARGSTTFPARFILVAAMNPCPCGEGGAPGACRCTEAARERYARRLSAPLLDRFDIALPVARPQVDELMAPGPAERTDAVAARVSDARRLAAGRGVPFNAALSGPALDQLAPMSSAAVALIEKYIWSGSLSARGLHRVHRLARTLADLSGGGDMVEEEHVREALLLRCTRDLLLGVERR
jgi:magnesium chelatase family protein